MRTNSSIFSRILLIGFPSEEYHRIQTILVEDGYEVSVAEFSTEPVEQVPLDLILLSAMTSNTDSNACIQQIRQQQNSCFIPVLLVTSDSLSRLQEIEANDFIQTPIKPDFLLHRVRVLLQWKQLIDELIQLNQQREDFVACLIHDLRSPLSAMNQVLRQILQGVFGNTLLELQGVLDQIVHSNQTLIQLVETLLSARQHELGQQSSNFFSIDLVELSQQVVNEMSPLAHQKGLSLMLRLEEQRDSAITVWGDRLELYRLLVNLISNAIQYTESGSIEVRFSSAISSDSPEIEYVVIEVEDTGVGIPAENLETAFARFQQGRVHQQGYGLGLYLCRQIVKAHQGSITVRSNRGSGSVFTIYLPAHTNN